MRCALRYFRFMKWLLLPLTIIQLVLILIWTAFCGIFALLLRIFLSPATVVGFISRHLWSPVMLVLSGMRLRVHGKQHLNPRQPSMYISNHESQLDILVAVCAANVPLFFVAKAELRKVPVLGHYMRAMGMIFVDRKNREKARESMMQAAERIRAGYNVITFPEGTRTKTGELLMFRRGSFIIAREGHVPIVPLAIRGTRRMLPSGSFFLRPGRVDVFIGKPVMPQEIAHLEPEDAAAYLREIIRKMLDQPNA